LEEFKFKLKQVAPKIYDVMEYEKGDTFDFWIENTLKNLPKK
jgi:hypothetical protein